MTTTWTAANDAARESYQRDGYLCPVDFLTGAEIATYRENFNELEQAEGQENCTIDLQGRHFDQRFVWDLATEQRLLDWIAGLVGPDLLLMSTHFFCKYPGPDDGHFVAWHQDVTYWGLEPANATTAWIALDDSDTDNGCMEVIPASHRHGVLEHGTSDQPNNLLASNQAIAERDLRLETAQPLELRAGQMSIHHGALAHASRPNVSNRRRCGLTVRFITPEVRQVEANNRGGYWQPVLVRGSDSIGNFPPLAAPF